MSTFHQVVSNYLHTIGLHERWQPSPSYIHACKLLKLPISGDTPRQKRKSARNSLEEYLGRDLIDFLA